MQKGVMRLYTGLSKCKIVQSNKIDAKEAEEHGRQRGATSFYSRLRVALRRDVARRATVALTRI